MNIDGHFNSRIMQILYSQAIVLLCNTHIKPLLSVIKGKTYMSF